MSEIYVSSGTVTSQTVTSGNTMYVLSSGTADFTTISSGGAQTVYDGGTADGSVVDSGGVLYVSAGGGTNDAAVFGQLIMSGGAVYRTSVGSGGAVFVASGGLYATTVEYGGYVELESHASGVVLNNGGFEAIFGGVQSGTTIYNGGELAIQSGLDSGALVEAGGQIDDTFGGAEYNAIVTSGGYLHVNAGGVATGIVVSSGGTEAVTANGTLGGTVLSGGTLIVAGGGDASGVTVNQGGIVITTGIAIYQGVSATIVEASTFTGLIVAGFPENAYILSGGVVHDLRLYDGAVAHIGAGATADGSVVSGGATLNIGYDSNVSGTTLSGAVAFNSGATVYATRIGSGGVDVVYGGIDSGSMLSAGGEQIIYGGAAIGATVSSGGEQYIDGVYAAAASSFTTLLAGGFEVVDNGGVASNTTIAGGVLELMNASGSDVGGYQSGGIDFSGSGGQLYTGTDNLANAIIAGFAPGDIIDIEDVTYTTTDSAIVFQPGVVTLAIGGTTYDLDISGVTSNTHFDLSAGYNGYGVALTENAPCFAAGTRILTPRGEIAVEALRVGDIVITSTGEDAAITWIGRRQIDLTRHSKPENAQPIRIAADALADGVPSRDLILSPDHALFLNHVLIPAKTLINHRNVQQLNRHAVTYYHIELAAHAIIFAENCAVETYLETGNRGAFENAAGALALHPDFAQTLREQQSCAPLITTGPALDAAAEQLARQYYTTRAARLRI